MASEKTPVIDFLWDILQDEGKGRRVVYQEDVVKAILECNDRLGLNLSTRNTANFMKDVVRGDRASDFWPERLTKARIGGRQRPGESRVFEFVDFLPGQTEAFPNKWMPHGLVSVPLETVSLPLASKSLGRKDESWLIQVAVNLKVFEYHFAVTSPLEVVELTHLQIGVKLGNSEVDSLFLATLKIDNDNAAKALITCEAKQEGQRILEHQLIEQIVAANRSIKGLNLGIDYIVPIAIKAIPPNGEVFIVEFAPWTPEMAELDESKLPDLSLASQALYALRPPVKGVGYSLPRTRRRRQEASARELPLA